MQGDVIWVNQSLATTDNLAYVDGNGKAIIKVDNTTNVPYNDKRDTVRLTDDVKNCQFTVSRSGSRPQTRSRLEACSCSMPCTSLTDAAFGQVKRIPLHYFVFVIADINFHLASFLDNG